MNTGYLVIAVVYMMMAVAVYMGTEPALGYLAIAVAYFAMYKKWIH